MDLAGKNILVVDDEPDLLELLYMTIAETGAVVCTAKNGLEATEHINRQQFDVVFTDVSMPKVDGVQLTSIIKNSTNNKDTQIFVVTGRATQDHIATLKHMGVAGIVTKPFRISQIHQLLRRAFAEPVEPDYLLNPIFERVVQASIRESIEFYLPDLKVSPGTLKSQDFRTTKVTTRVPIFGRKVYGSITFTCDIEFYRSIATQLMAEPPEDDKEIMADCMAEVSNQIAGCFKRLLTDNGVYVAIGLPETYFNQKVTPLVGNRSIQFPIAWQQTKACLSCCFGDFQTRAADDPDFSVYHRSLRKSA